MKHIEKIAVESIFNDFKTENAQLIGQCAEAKSLLDAAQSTFKKFISEAFEKAREEGKVLVDEEVSEEALELFTSKVTELFKIPFKLK